MTFGRLSNDVISLIKPDGTVVEGIKANVQPNLIFIHDEQVPLEEGDKIYRKLPNGLVETYVVLDRGYHSQRSVLPGHYQAKVRKEGSIKEQQYQSIINIYNASGPNSRVNINSTDNSVNINSNQSLLFEEIRGALESIKEKEVQERSLLILEELKKTQNTPNYLSNYQSFIATLSNHMTLIAPFIPALTQLM